MFAHASTFAVPEQRQKSIRQADDLEYLGLPQPFTPAHEHLNLQTPASVTSVAGRLNSINQYYVPQLEQVQNKESCNGDISPNLADGRVGINIEVPDLSAIMQPTAIFGA